MHYMRIPRVHWRDRLLKLRAAGLNAIQTWVPLFFSRVSKPTHQICALIPQSLFTSNYHTFCRYIQWSLHEPWPGVYDFDGNLDISSYFKEAQDLGLAVIVRLGPYIDAEVDMVSLWSIKELLVCWWQAERQAYFIGWASILASQKGPPHEATNKWSMWGFSSMAFWGIVVILDEVLS